MARALAITVHVHYCPHRVIKLKVDRHFVSQIPHDDNDVAIARSITALGTMMQFIVLAEGVETQAQRDFLLANGCHQAQGYWFSKPLPADEITPLLPVA